MHSSVLAYKFKLRELKFQGEKQYVARKCTVAYTLNALPSIRTYLLKAIKKVSVQH